MALTAKKRNKSNVYQKKECNSWKKSDHIGAKQAASKLHSNNQQLKPSKSATKDTTFHK